MNCDTLVSAADVTELLVLLPSGDPGECGTGDVNDDGVVDLDDVRALIDAIFAARATGGASSLRPKVR